MKKLLKTKVGLAVCLMLLSTVFPTVFSGLVWFIARKHFLRAWVILFGLFGAPVFLGGLFMLLGLAKGHEPGAAAGFYYGGLFLSAIIGGRPFRVVNAVFGFGLSAVIVYLVITRHKS